MPVLEIGKVFGLCLSTPGAVLTDQFMFHLRFKAMLNFDFLFFTGLQGQIPSMEIPFQAALMWKAFI